MAVTYGVQKTISFPMSVATGGYPTSTFKTGLTGSLTCLRNYDGGSFNACTNSAAEIASTGVYALTLTAAEMAHENVSLKMAAAGACDQFVSLETDHIAEVKAKTDTIGALTMTVTSPVAANGAITIYAGDSYDLAANAHSLHFTLLKSGIPDITGAAVKLKLTQATWTGALTSDGTNWYMDFTPTKAQTALLTIFRQNYEVEATLTGAPAQVLTLQTGVAMCVADVPVVP